MAIIVKTARPHALIAAIKEAIDGGKIHLWRHDEDGDFTRSDDQWHAKAWLRPAIREDGIVFRIFPRANSALSVGEYAVYHASFVEMLLRHFDRQFTETTATARPKFGDRVGGRRT